MPSERLKKTIQSHYSRLLENKKLTARYGQKLMIAEIYRSIGEVETDVDGQRSAAQPPICVVEAGTGTGKTIAYLVAALPIAQALNKKVVIATATVALQEQVMFKDLPDLQRHSGMKFSYTLAKGRGRYLCLSKLDNVLKADSSQAAMLDLYGLALADPGQPDPALYQRMLEALADQSWQGDRDDWPQVLDEGVWRNVSVDHGQCSGNRCSNFSNCCFFRSRENLQKVDCIVANHDLVLADLNLGGGVILPDPADTLYIFDEAHHLPVKGTSHFSHFIRLRATGKWLEQIPLLLNRLLSDTGTKGSFPALIEKAGGAALAARAALNEHNALFEQFAAQADAGNGRGEVRQYTFRGGVIPDAMRELCHQLQRLFAEVQQSLDRLQESIKKAMEGDSGELPRQQAETWFPVLGSTLTRAQAAEQLWHSFARADPAGKAPLARWMSFADTGGEVEITVSSSPVLAAEALAAGLWNDCFAAILTSATLTALGNFDFLRMRAGLHEKTCYSRIASPFDYGRAASIRIPASGFDPADGEAHTRAIRTILPVILEPGEASLVLFSSRRQLQDVLAGLEPELAGKVLSQDDYSKQQLLDRHRDRIEAGQGSIIFGLASFTEGIDLPGNYCRHVVIAKIPFAVPNDPVEATLGEWVKSQGRNPFMEISVPEASMRLIQATGRLLRLESDTGLITILDERLLTRRYGQDILDSLPPYRRQVFEPRGLTRAAWRKLSADSIPRDDDAVLSG
ncbi:MAG: ATP-dependent DNA helicase DinG [Pseudomonadales bacterium]|nr:ATP-dependent DNA helicase DinG [Pseudomonadales bacterium]